MLRSLFVTHFKKLRVLQKLILLYLWFEILLEDPMLKGKLIGQASRHQRPQVRSTLLWVFETTGVAHFLQKAAHSLHQIVWVIRQRELQGLHDELFASFSWGLAEYLFFFLGFREELRQSVRGEELSLFSFRRLEIRTRLKGILRNSTCRRSFLCGFMVQFNYILISLKLRLIV